MLTLNELPSNDGAYIDGMPCVVRNVLTLESYAKDASIHGMITSKREAAYKLIMEADAFLKSSVSGTSAELVEINAALSEHGERLTAVESSAKQAHHRIDEIVGDKK